MRGLVLIGPLLLALACPLASAQSQATPVLTSTGDFTADYPADRAGVLIQSSSWQPVSSQTPARTKVGRGLAASLSYGVVPAKILAEYEGEHASTEIAGGQPILCICHLISLPGSPVIVRLHPKEGARELDGGRMIVYPVVGNSKMADANKTDLLPVDIGHPEPNVWLVRPSVALAPGEYALMMGTQNIIIYPFTVTAAAADASGRQ